MGLTPWNSAIKGFTFPVVIDLSKVAMQEKFIAHIHHDLNMHFIMSYSQLSFTIYDTLALNPDATT